MTGYLSLTFAVTMQLVWLLTVVGLLGNSLKTRQVNKNINQYTSGRTQVWADRVPRVVVPQLTQIRGWSWLREAVCLGHRASYHLNAHLYENKAFSFRWALSLNSPPGALLLDPTGGSDPKPKPPVIGSHSMRSPWSALRVWGSTVSSPSGIQGTAEIEFGAF